MNGAIRRQRDIKQRRGPVYVCVSARPLTQHMFSFEQVCSIRVCVLSTVMYVLYKASVGQTAGSGEQSPLNDPPVNVILLDIPLPPV